MPSSAPFTKVIHSARLRLRMGKLLDAVFYALVAFACIAIPIELIPPLHPLVSLFPMIGTSFLIIFNVLATLQFPTLSATAAHLDQTNRSHDLLSTALYSLKNSDDWSATIIRLADQQSASMALPPMTGKITPAMHLASWSGITGIMLLSILVQNTSPIATAQKIESLNDESSLTPQLKSQPNPRTEEASSRLQQSDEDSSDKSDSSQKQNQNPGQSASGTGKSDAKFTDSPSANPPDKTTGIPQSQSNKPLAGLALKDRASTDLELSEIGSSKENPTPHLWESHDWKSRQSDLDPTKTQSTDTEYRDLIRDYFAR